MRKCRFKIYDSKARQWSDFQDGNFHQFGTELQEDDRGFHENTIAVVEDTSGQLHKVEVHTVQLLNI